MPTRLLLLLCMLPGAALFGQSQPYYVMGQAHEWLPDWPQGLGTDSLSGNGNPVRVYSSWAELATQSRRRPQPVLLTLPLDSLGTLPRWSALRRVQHVRQVTIWLPPLLTQALADSLLTTLASWPDLESMVLTEREPAAPPHTGPAPPVAAPIDGRLSRLLTQVRWLGVDLVGPQLANGIRLLASCPAAMELGISGTGSSLPMPLPAAMSRLTTLRTVQLSGVFDPDSLAAALATLTELTNLALYATPYSRQLSQTLRRLPALRRLTLGLAAGTTRFRVADLPQLTALTCLGRTGDPFPADSVLAGETSLTELRFLQCTLPSMNWLVNQVRLQRLTMTSCQLPPSDVSLRRLTRLATVCLERPTLQRHFPAWVATLPALTELTIQAAQLASLPPSVGQLTSLTALNLAQNGLRFVPLGLGALRALKTLNLSSNQIRRLPAILSPLTQLTALDLSDNQLTELPVGTGRMVGLRQLNLSHNPLTSLPADLLRCRRLQSLDVGETLLATLPVNLGDLDSLRTLTIGSPRLRRIPVSIGRLVRLQTLHLDAGWCRSLPESIGNCQRLSELFVSTTGLTTLPASLTNLTRLTQLSLSLPNLQTLPEGIGHLHRLTNLSLHRSGVARLPSGVCALDSLRILFVQSARLARLPACLGRLRQLTDLTIRGDADARTRRATGRLTHLPGSLSLCHNLRSLTISNQRAFGGAGAMQTAAACPALRHIDLDNAGVTSLAGVDWKTLRITSLRLRGNKLIHLPPALPDAPALALLDLANNPLLPPGLAQLFTGKAGLRAAMAAGRLTHLPTHVPSDTVMWAYLNAGVQRRYRRDLTGALADMTVAIRVAPDTLRAIALMYRAELWLHWQQPAKAITDFRAAIAAGPRSGTYPFELHMYSSALTNGQLLAVYCGRLSVAHERLGQHRQALTALDAGLRAVKADTDDDRQERAGLLVDKALIYARWQRPAAARACLQEAYRGYVQTRFLLPRYRLVEPQLALLGNLPEEARRSLGQFWQQASGVRIDEGLRSVHAYLTFCQQVLAGSLTAQQAQTALATYLSENTETIYAGDFREMTRLLPRVALPPGKRVVLLRLTKLMERRVYR